ncbi:conserved hypothetical protein [Burkholderia pseudomallei Pakistan 9]|nr:conserved hypothetical protein [Burkholderia pseudomallei Pakistan 9]
MLYSGYQCGMIVSDNQIDFHFTPKFHQRHINHVPIRPSTRPSRRTWFT